MESFKIEGLSFTYPMGKEKALNNINLEIKKGEFITLCGKSGCGKTTLLRLLKPSVSPFGNAEGKIFFENKPLKKYSLREEAEKIGFVMQNPDNQIVTDKVWHELAFGLENLGCKTSEIRTRVSEMASFFGIEKWFYYKTSDLSGGQKQLLNLASVMVMQPSVLILDEPAAQLDPIASGEFLKTLERINRELGTTVILSEHRLEDAFPVSDRIIVMDEGKIISDAPPCETGKILKGHEMYKALPTPVRVFGEVEGGEKSPLSVREGRKWLEEFSKTNKLYPELIEGDKETDSENIIEIKDVWFRYEKNLPDVVKGLELEIKRGEIFSVLGGNGSGKTTTLRLISGLSSPLRGKILNKGGRISLLPQNPQSLFVKKTLFLDLFDMIKDEEKIYDTAKLCRIENLLDNHPYDLSGGEQQRAALCKVLLSEPEILLLDEPTKGLDANFKEIFAEILNELKSNGVTIVMVSHDIEFCAEYADRCAMFFDGNITSVDTPKNFFKGKSFYTTAANRMARTKLENAVLVNDVISACLGKKQEKKKPDVKIEIRRKEKKEIKKEKKKISPFSITSGIVFAIIFAFSVIMGFISEKNEGWKLLSVASAFFSLLFFFPGNKAGYDIESPKKYKEKLSRRTVISAILILLAIPATIWMGFTLLDDKKYYFISLLIIFETMIPFMMVFESRKPEARELIIISVLCGIAVAGRAAFAMIPQFKPVVALVIISGICFGGETGFFVGAVTGFVSNFFFGQGPLTPWQMFAFGIIGFLSGILFKKGLLPKNKISLCIFGGITTFVIYGGIMNPASIIVWQPNPTKEMIITSFVTGFGFDVIHSLSTILFLWFISEGMIDKLERVKIKYGLIER